MRPSFYDIKSLIELICVLALALSFAALVLSAAHYMWVTAKPASKPECPAVSHHAPLT